MSTALKRRYTYPGFIHSPYRAALDYRLESPPQPADTKPTFRYEVWGPGSMLLVHRSEALNYLRGKVLAGHPPWSRPIEGEPDDGRKFLVKTKLWTESVRFCSWDASLVARGFLRDVLTGSLTRTGTACRPRKREETP